MTASPIIPALNCGNSKANTSLGRLAKGGLHKRRALPCDFDREAENGHWMHAAIVGQVLLSSIFSRERAPSAVPWFRTIFTTENKRRRMRVVEHPLRAADILKLQRRGGQDICDVEWRRWRKESLHWLVQHYTSGTKAERC